MTPLSRVTAYAQSLAASQIPPHLLPPGFTAWPVEDAELRLSRIQDYALRLANNGVAADSIRRTSDVWARGVPGKELLEYRAHGADEQFRSAAEREISRRGMGSSGEVRAYTREEHGRTETVHAYRHVDPAKVGFSTPHTVVARDRDAQSDPAYIDPRSGSHYVTLGMVERRGLLWHGIHNDGTDTGPKATRVLAAGAITDYHNQRAAEHHPDPERIAELEREVDRTDPLRQFARQQAHDHRLRSMSNDDLTDELESTWDAHDSGHAPEYSEDEIKGEQERRAAAVRADWVKQHPEPRQEALFSQMTPLTRILALAAWGGAVDKELGRTRHVATPGGVRLYKAPIGTPITAKMREEAKAQHGAAHEARQFDREGGQIGRAAKTAKDTNEAALRGEAGAGTFGGGFGQPGLGEKAASARPSGMMLPGGFGMGQGATPAHLGAHNAPSPVGAAVFKSPDVKAAALAGGITEAHYNALADKVANLERQLEAASKTAKGTAEQLHESHRVTLAVAILAVAAEVTVALLIGGAAATMGLAVAAPMLLKAGESLAEYHLASHEKARKAVAHPARAAAKGGKAAAAKARSASASVKTKATQETAHAVTRAAMVLPGKLPGSVKAPAKSAVPAHKSRPTLKPVRATHDAALLIALAASQSPSVQDQAAGILTSALVFHGVPPQDAAGYAQQAVQSAPPPSAPGKGSQGGGISIPAPDKSKNPAPSPASKSPAGAGKNPAGKSPTEAAPARTPATGPATIAGHKVAAVYSHPATSRRIYDLGHGLHAEGEPGQPPGAVLRSATGVHEQAFRAKGWTPHKPSPAQRKIQRSPGRKAAPAR